jgi:hypothetical protein
MKTKFKKVASIMLVSMIILIANNSIQAQQRGQQGPPPMPTDDQIEQMVEDLDKALSLTDEQEKQISEKYFAHFEEVEKMIKAGRPSREDMETLEADFNKEVKLLLTEDQKEPYNAFLKEQQKKRPKRQKK